MTQSEPSVRRPKYEVRDNRESLYRTSDYLTVRAPLLPIDAYLRLAGPGPGGPSHGGQEASGNDECALMPGDAGVQLALLVGSRSLFDSLKAGSGRGKGATRLRGKLLRYLIRMSTRPTPFGLFAGVALAEWADETDLAIRDSPPRRRTRPDMGWLLSLVSELESNPEIRRGLRYVAHPAASIRGGRVFLGERATARDPGPPATVSVRATKVVRRLFELARRPIAHGVLSETLVAETGAAPEKVENLITELWRQSLVLTDLHPPLTHEAPARYVVDRLEEIPAGVASAGRLKSVLSSALEWDSLDPADAVLRFGEIAAPIPGGGAGQADVPLQVDATVPLHGNRIGREVGREVCRAAEILLSLTPHPDGPPHLVSYRRAFLERYSLGQEVPLLELLDPNAGLGPLSMHVGHAPATDPRSLRRARSLVALACRALAAREPVVELDEHGLSDLRTWQPSALSAPFTLDLCVAVAAESSAAIDDGAFQIIVGPNVGASEGGRMVGRFADLFGEEIVRRLRTVARDERSLSPGVVPAELIYTPRTPRSANVVVRPAIREFEILLDGSPGVDPSRVIPLDELVVGVRGGRFAIRWPRKDAEVRIHSGHMLNSMQAPEVARFLADVHQDGRPCLTGFDWGPASGFPFLPRVQTGRIVLRPAEWKIDRSTSREWSGSRDPEAFRSGLDRWRERWSVPRHVYLTSADNRLLLDLDDRPQVDELRREFDQLVVGGALVLQEVIPRFDELWAEGPQGRFVTELAVPLVLKEAAALPPADGPASVGMRPKSTDPGLVAPGDRLKPPGSDWLFVKLYCGADLENDLIAGELRSFAEGAVASGMADRWFFLRYADPDRHLRLRLGGIPPERAGRLLARTCEWASTLVRGDLCRRFSLESYQREIERYGGPAGIEVSERLFSVDSSAVSEMLAILQARQLELDATELGVLSVDNLLSGLGLSEEGRLGWLRGSVTSRASVGQEYRRRQGRLRGLLGDADGFAQLGRAGGSLARCLEAARIGLAPVATELDRLNEWGRGIVVRSNSAIS